MNPFEVPEEYRSRVADAVKWAKSIYGNPASANLEFEVELPHRVDVSHGYKTGVNAVYVHDSAVPPVQRTGSKVKVHPMIASRRCPRYVLRFLLAMTIIRGSTGNKTLLRIKEGLAPHREQARSWLIAKGFPEESWDI
ncbi:MAG: hypothetical protein RJQ08_11535 [Salinisphaeraceae bacterium]